MPQNTAQGRVRPLRADAARNRRALLDAAHEAFSREGVAASLDDIARSAGVGPGTLYRHFPKRENLLDAVMQSWVDRVQETVDKALAYEGSDRDLLLNWFEQYVALISQHKGGPAKITSAMGNPDSPIMTKCQVLATANRRVIDHLGEHSALRDDVDVIQVCRLVGGVATVADQAGLDADAVRPMLAVLADGLMR